jgi:hypothetical protein
MYKRIMVEKVRRNFITEYFWFKCNLNFVHNNKSLIMSYYWVCRKQCIWKELE